MSLSTADPVRRNEPAVASLAREPLFPRWLMQPLALAGVAIAPQLILILLNLRAYAIAAGEMTAPQKATSLQIFAFEVFLVVGCGALAAVLHVRGRAIAWHWNWPLLLAPIGYLWLVTAAVQSAIPTTVADWILPRGEVLYYQYALTMPLVFYAGLRLACVEINSSRMWEIGLLAAAVVAVPLLFFFALNLVRDIGALGALVVGTTVVAIIVGTLIVLGAFARLCVIGYVEVQHKGPRALALFTVVVAAVMPIAGLLLNRYIPFPYDFQAWPVYALALANGCVLLLPNFRHPRLHRLVWLAQCGFFPFTVYFFLIFLPFLPLSVPAMIYVGAGFLMLTPTALFLLHGQRLLDGFRHETRQHGRVGIALLAGAAFAILPASYIAEALIDRSVLRGAIDYVYSPDYRANEQFAGSRAAVARSLERLRDRKAGLNLPFLSDFYTWAVFNNLVLPDDKMNAIHQAFFGRDVPEPPVNAVGMFAAQAVPRRELREARPVVLPPQNVALVGLAAATVREGSSLRTTFTLDLENTSQRQSEYVTRLTIPEGVFVSGYWLKVGEERVPGRIFEKKTALWVYHMIRDWTRRDPGILTYADARTVELRVFPFAPMERRRTEIELLYPATLNPAIKISDGEWQGEGNVPAIAVALTSEGTSAAMLAAEAVAHLPPARRPPYLHFIVDRSAAAKMSDEQIVSAMRNAGARIPAAKECL
ncbi:MAG TPA: MSEP-CTERM sorting domain-containing protein, partial [Chthoniobacterales bacterium]